MSAVANVVLFSPEIAGNTGNIIRLCANTGASLHLIEPLGFEPDEAKVRRAGLDYREFAAVSRHENLDACWQAIGPTRVFGLSARANRMFHQPTFEAGDTLIFGPESTGLPDGIMAAIPEDQQLRIPMQPNSRSLNLSNAVAVTVYEVLRQLGYPMDSTPPAASTPLLTPR